MREPNDKKLAENVPEIDLILGGHDHHYEIYEVVYGDLW
jgi:5'-nucleotidase